VLAGIIAARLVQARARGPDAAAFEAVCAGVWLHGAAGRACGPGLIAEDLPEALPGVFRVLWGEAGPAR
jgi:NAD(P)H-hydrate epimerase